VRSAPAAALAAARKLAYPDHTARDPKSEYYDPGATAEKPRWFMVDVKWTSTLPRLIPLEMLRRNPALRRMLILRRGNRLSVTPVSADEWAAILAMAG
jgi:predicted RNA-binding protein with PUA-like domain